MEITGTLRNARRIKKGEDPRAPCLVGNVYGDARGRFRDGEYITTSTIMDETGDVFTTRYSAYRVETWAEVQPKYATIYDPPSGWKYGFPKPYKPLPNESLEQTLLRDGYPQHEIDNGGAKHCRFIEVPA
jgi:hypothetical protein